MKNSIRVVMVAFLAIGWLLVSFSCARREQNISPSTDNEFVSTIKYRLTNINNPSDTPSAIIRRRDSDDRIAPDTSRNLLILKANSSYIGQMILLDTTKNPVEDMTAEIRLLNKFHCFFYQPLPINNDAGRLIIPGTPITPNQALLNLKVTITDTDDNTPPLPLGLTTKIISGSASNGKLRIVLRHQPEGKNGTFAPGSSDLDFTYRVSVQ